MAALGYKFYLRVLKVSLTSERSEQISERYFQHSKIKFVSPHGHVISSMYSEINFKDNFVHLLRRPKNCY